MTALFITLEGIEGVGKSTQCHMLKQKMLEHNISTIITREPGGTKFGENTRHLILNTNDTLYAKTQLLLHMAARNEHIMQVILPNIRNNITVISDRFCDSSFAYQGSDNTLSLDYIINLHQMIFDNFFPNISFFLDLDPEIAHYRMQKRGQAPDRYESLGIEYQYSVYKMFKILCERYPDRIIAIDASQTAAKITKDMFSYIMNKLKINDKI